MDRRTLLKRSAALVALGAIGGGVWIQRNRQEELRRSAVITGPWQDLGRNSGRTRDGRPRSRSHSWLLPDLQQAPMLVPDRPHRIEEAMDAGTRNNIRRVRTFTVSSSHQRLRDQMAPPKPKGELRILAVGDSVTFGWGVTQQEAWPAQLEARLVDQGLPVRVLNCGVPANPLHTMAAFVTQVGPRHKPDLVLFCRRPATPNAQEYRQAWQSASAAGVPMLACLPPISRFDLMGQKMYQQEQALVQEITGHRPVELTDDIRTAQGQRGFGVRPQATDVELFNLKSGEVLASAPQTQRDLPLSFYEIIDEDDAIREPLMFDSGHPDAEGFTVVAQTLSRTILERKLLPS